MKAADDDHHDRDRDRKAQRYYDRSTHDWHEWNEREDRAYRQYMDERKHQYRDFQHAKKRDQDDYWKWRHAHPDRD